jgi:hypothetical protein
VNGADARSYRRLARGPELNTGPSRSFGISLGQHTADPFVRAGQFFRRPHPKAVIASKARARGRSSAVAANLLMVSLEPVELLDHHPAGRKGVRILARKSDRQENLGKARIRSRRLARILGGRKNKLVDHFSGALDALNRDAAAMSIAEKEAAGLRKQRRVGRLGHTNAHERENRNGDRQS